MKCYNCERAIPEEALYCPFCGAEQKPQVCSVCGENLLPGAAFCMKCGGKVEEREHYPVRKPKVKKQGSITCCNIFLWIKFSLSSIFCLLMIAFLFLPIGKANVMQLTGFSLDIDIKYNTIDVFKALPYLSEDSDVEEFMEYIYNVFEEHLSEDLLDKLPTIDDPNELSRSEFEELSQAFNHINPFAIFMVKEARRVGKFTIISLIILVVLYIALMAGFAVLLGVSIYNLVRKHSDKWLGATHNVLMTIALFAYFYTAYFNRTTNFDLASGPILILIFGILPYLLFAVFELIKAGKRISAFWIIKKGVSFVFAVLILLMINLKLVRYEYAYINDKGVEATITDSESLHKFSAYFNKILQPDYKPQNDDDFYEEIDTMLKHNPKKLNRLYLDLLWDSSVVFSIHDMQIFSPDILIPIVYALHIISIVLLGLIIRRNLLDFKAVEDRAKKATFIYGIILIVFLAAILGLAIFLVYSLNDSYDYLKLKHEASLNIGIYFGFAFMLCLFIWNLVFPTRPKLSEQE
jgi:ABC-type multidrug transport system fused ATPase/permease subunit